MFVMESLCVQIAITLCSQLRHQQTADPHEAICPVHLKPGLISEEHTFLAINQVKTLVRTTSTQISLPETVTDSGQTFFDCANQQFHQLSGFLVSDNPASEEAGCGGRGL